MHLKAGNKFNKEFLTRPYPSMYNSSILRKSELQIEIEKRKEWIFISMPLDYTFSVFSFTYPAAKVRLSKIYNRILHFVFFFWQSKMRRKSVIR